MSPDSSQPQARAPRPLRARTAAAVCAVVGSLLSVTACGNDSGSVTSAAEAGQEAGAARATPSTPAASASLSREREQRKELVASAQITWDKAADKAVAEVPQSKLVDLELERTPQRPSPSETASPRPSRSPGAPRWSATVAQKDGTAHIVIIDAVTGQVIEERAEQGQDSGDKQQLAGLLAQATQTPAQAVKTATDKQPGTVTGVQLDDDDKNVAVWQVEVANTDDWTESDFEIDAAKGDIVSQRVDRD
ncbi:lipoprotein [Streptomyces inusitatus]|uniref:Lipoprotein n=1 Tax=Streptomyces inusitatus TaxID=68221 RepID=A0A918UZU8_9ACTN|nr:PepSY domain-containing protein [Streptomyces inusitatus]GGZ50530.1 lipoprotein [Streptomyces inusitatus]